MHTILGTGAAFTYRDVDVVGSISPVQVFSLGFVHSTLAWVVG